MSLGFDVGFDLPMFLSHVVSYTMIITPRIGIMLILVLASMQAPMTARTVHAAVADADEVLSSAAAQSSGDGQAVNEADLVKTVVQKLIRMESAMEGQQPGDPHDIKFS